ALDTQIPLCDRLPSATSASLFFFSSRRRHTRSTRDWSSDVCSSDLPAGTIHAIGPGLVLAEIQQRSDTTFRLFDHGRQREIHVRSEERRVGKEGEERGWGEH